MIGLLFGIGVAILIPVVVEKAKRTRKAYAPASSTNGRARTK